MDDEPETAILEATDRALCEHVDADLPMQRIADESNLSEAAIHYHDDTDLLFETFLEHLYERCTGRLDEMTGETARHRLDALLDVHSTDTEADPGIDFHTAMLEVRVQAPYDETIRETLNAFDEALVSRLRETSADGIDAGEFADCVDPDLAADRSTTAIKGTHTRQVAVGHPLARSSGATRTDVDASLTGEKPSEVTA